MRSKSDVHACIECGVRITQKPGRGRAKLRCTHCADDHRLALNRIRSAPKAQTCRRCDGPRERNHSYCAACKPAHRSNWQQHPITCPGCKELFTPPNSRRRYCSQDCWLRSTGVRTVTSEPLFLWRKFDPTSQALLCGPARQPEHAVLRTTLTSGAFTIECPWCFRPETATTHGWNCINPDCDLYRWELTPA